MTVTVIPKRLMLAHAIVSQTMKIVFVFVPKFVAVSGLEVLKIFSIKDVYMSYCPTFLKYVHLIHNWLNRVLQTFMKLRWSFKF